jgi:hypothetical protein
MLEMGTKVNVVFDGRGKGVITDSEDGRYEVTYLAGTKGAREVGHEWLIPGAEKGLLHGDFIVYKEN